MRVTRALLWTLTACLLAGCGGDEPEAPGQQVGADPALRAVVRGGLLYDKFWKASDASEPESTHPMWAERPDKDSNARTGSTTWRCKECHGWDYQGVEGAYARGSHRTGFAGVLGSGATDEAWTTSLADAHGYRAAGLTDSDFEALVAFLRTGLVDTTKWIDEEGRFRGDADRGRGIYLKGVGAKKACTSCHGPTGLKPPAGPDERYEDFVGKVANANPTEFLHKVRFGYPGTQMPSALAAGMSMQDIVDLCAYAQTLPQSR